MFTTTIRARLRTALVALLAGLAGATAQANLLVNGSFEGVFDGPMRSLTETDNPLPGWSLSTIYFGSPEVGWMRNGAFGTSASDGTAYVDLTGTRDGLPGGLSQTVTIVPFKRYRLSLDLGGAVGLCEPHDFSCAGPINVVVSVGGAPWTLSFVPTSTEMQWQTYSFVFSRSDDFDPEAVLSIMGIATDPASQFLGVDNVVLTRLDAPPPTEVPEPATWALMAGGLALLRRWRR